MLTKEASARAIDSIIITPHAPADSSCLGMALNRKRKNKNPFLFLKRGFENVGFFLMKNYFFGTGFFICGHLNNHYLVVKI